MSSDKHLARKPSNREQLRVAGPTDTTDVAPIQNRDLPRMTTLAFQRRPKEGGQTLTRGTIGIAGAADETEVAPIESRDLPKMYSDDFVKPIKTSAFTKPEAPAATVPSMSRVELALADAFARMASARAALAKVEDALGRVAEAIMNSEDLLAKNRGSGLPGEDLAARPSAAGDAER
jgi:hypothetical protein